MQFCAPHIGKLADELAAVHPQIANDIPFVVKESLKHLEQDFKQITKNSKDAFYWWTTHGLTTTTSSTWWCGTGVHHLVPHLHREIDWARESIAIHVDPLSGLFEWFDTRVLRAIDFVFRPEN